MGVRVDVNVGHGAGEAAEHFNLGPSCEPFFWKVWAPKFHEKRSLHRYRPSNPRSRIDHFQSKS